MQTDRKKKLLIMLLAATLSLAGCRISPEPVEFVFRSPIKQSGAATSKKFQQPGEKGPSMVESAIRLSEKYAKLSEQTTELKKENQLLISENAILNNKLVSSRRQLQQTQKELNQANDLLIEMTIELNNWKTNILGFQDEMRQAQEVQLEALYKILKTLGGETAPGLAKAQDTNTSSLNKSQSKVLRTAGASNE